MSVQSLNSVQSCAEVELCLAISWCLSSSSSIRSRVSFAIRRDLIRCQKTDDFYLGRGRYPLLSYCLPGSLMNQAHTRKLKRDHTMKVKRSVRDKQVFPSSLNHLCLLLVDNVTLYKSIFNPIKHQ
jgi:hypothetical protein